MAPPTRKKKARRPQKAKASRKANPKQRDVLKAARVARGLKQAQMARRLGVTQATISRVEKGQLVPRNERLVDFATEYRVPLETFVMEAAA